MTGDAIKTAVAFPQVSCQLGQGRRNLGQTGWLGVRMGQVFVYSLELERYQYVSSIKPWFQFATYVIGINNNLYNLTCLIRIDLKMSSWDL